MSVLSGRLINAHNIILPYSERTEMQYGDKLYSYGCGPAGYDVRVEFDPLEVYQRKVLHPGDFLLASTIEQFCMPDDVLGEVKDKSTWIRRGLTVHNTVIEPGWRGYLTLELKNQGLDTLTIHRGQPIAQVIFYYVTGDVTPYNGKYQNQARGPQDAR